MPKRPSRPRPRQLLCIIVPALVGHSLLRSAARTSPTEQRAQAPLRRGNRRSDALGLVPREPAQAEFLPVPVHNTTRQLSKCVVIVRIMTIAETPRIIITQGSAIEFHGHCRPAARNLV